MNIALFRRLTLRARTGAVDAGSVGHRRRSFGNPASLVVSFIFYGLILILLPRLTLSTKAVE